MNSRQRIERALHHQEPDRTPMFEYVLLSPLADHLLGHPYAGDPIHWDALVREVGWAAAVQQNAADRVELAILLGHDMLYITPNEPPPPKDLPVPPLSVQPPPAAADPVASLRRRCQVTVESFTTPLADDIFTVYHLTQAEMRRRGVDLPILAPAYFHGVWTDTDLMQTLLLDPATAHRHFALATRQALRVIDKYLALGIDQIGIGGDFAGTRLIISPRAYRTFIVPEVRKLAQVLHQHNKVAVNASDGSLWQVLDDFITGCDVDAYLEIDQFAGMDLAKLKSACGSRVTLYGNMDCGNVLSFSSPQVVAEETVRCLKAGMGSGGHIFCASNAITASVPLANYMAMLNAYRSFFGLQNITLPPNPPSMPGSPPACGQQPPASTKSR